MKQICTQIAFFCLLIIGQNLYAQNSVTISKTNPLPTPGFNAPDSVKSSNGFTSTNTGTFEDFAPHQTDTIISPQYYYNFQQSVINFAFNSSAANSGVDVIPTVLIITGGDTSSASPLVSHEFKGASVNYYFTFTLATPLPANTNFKIAVVMTLGPKAIKASTFATNATKGIAPINSSLPLPVTFAGFYARETSSGILLTWKVGFEENVEGYEIQKSLDGINFAKIGFVSAAAHPSYNYTDTKSSASAYYRIKSIDIDGKYMYSMVVSLKGEASSVVMKAFPSPVQSQLTIQHNSINSNSTIEVVSVDGKVIKAVNVSANTQQTGVDLSNAKAGIYVVRFIKGNAISTMKIVKQ